MPDHHTLSPTYHAVAAAAAQDKSFVNFDLGLAPEALQDMQSLKIEHDADYSNFGQIDCLRDDIVKFLTANGNPADVSGRVADVLDQVVKDSLSAVGAEAAFFALRSFTPTDAYDVPRWHADGWFYTPDGTRQQKIAMALKGAKTLLNDFPNTLREKFYDVLRNMKEDTTEKRREIEKLVPADKTVTALDGQATIFDVGNIKDAAVHSEPPIHCERLFMSVVPGTMAQIRELQKNWDTSPTCFTGLPQPPQTPAPR